MIAVARKHENVYIDTSAYTSKRIPAELAELDSLGLDAEARELYLQGNARRVFGLD